MADADKNNSGLELKKLLSLEFPFNDLVKLENPQYETGHGEMTMVVRHELLRAHGILHGGACATLIDSAIGVAAFTVAPQGLNAITVQLNINLTRPCWQGDTLVAKADVEHHGKKTAVIHCRVHNQEGKLVATGTATSMFVPFLPNQK